MERINTQDYIRFEDQALQTAFVVELDRAAIHYTRDGDGNVRYEETDAPAVIDAAHRIRDAQFPWYFLKWPTESESLRFRSVLEDAGLPFFVEYHESGIWFLVRRADEVELDRLWLMVLD